MRTREKQTYHLLSRRSLFCAKTVPASAMRACSQIAERSLSYAKTVQGECSSKAGKRSFTRLDGAEPMPVLCKDNTNYSMNKIKAQIKCKKTPSHQLPGSHPPLPLSGHAPTARGTHHPCLMLHTSPPSAPSPTTLIENPEAETRCFLDFFFTKQNRETDILTTQKRTFRTPLTPLRHASTPLPIHQKGFSGSPQSPFHDAERAVSQRERASLTVPKSPSGNAGQCFPRCQNHHKESKPLNINNLEKPLENRVFRIRRKSRSKQPILADIRQKTRACQATPHQHKNGFSHRTVTEFLKSIQACRTPVIRHKKTARSRYFSLLLAAHNNPVTDGTPAYLPWCSSDTVSFLRP